MRGEIFIQINRQADTQTDRQTDRQKKQTNRQRDKHTYRQKNMFGFYWLYEDPSNISFLKYLL